ncbi:hypothetical protein CRUP_037427, partial [Coryphaenoides rupestris]
MWKFLTRRSQSDAAAAAATLILGASGAGGVLPGSLLQYGKQQQQQQQQPRGEAALRKDSPSKSGVYTSKKTTTYVAQTRPAFPPQSHPTRPELSTQTPDTDTLGTSRCVAWTMRPWAGSWRWITLVLLAWGTLLFYIGGHLVRDSEHPERSSRELSKILAKLERLKQQNEDLRRMAESLSFSQRLVGDGPGATQEELRRRVENGVKELWYFVRSEVKKLSLMEAAERQKYAESLLQDLGHQERSIMTEMYYLSQADGVGEWRVKEAHDLSSLVQNRIT